MAMPPTVRRRRLGIELRRLREKTGLTAEAAAEATGMSQPKIARIENGRGAAKVDDVTKLLDLYGCTDPDVRTSLIEITKTGHTRGWWLSYRDAITPITNDLIMLETEAATFKTYENSFIPGLFQTAEYARNIIEQLRVTQVGTVEDLVQVRMARQSVLSRPNPLEVWAVIHEAALTAFAKEPEIMGPQLDRILSLGRLPNVNIQVMPVGASAHPGMAGPFSVVGFPHRADLDVVLVEGLLNSLWVEDPSDVELYRSKFTAITAEAMSIPDSASFITAQRDKIR
ncbi:helix-turn-helix domain-containing protein [Kitasatospora sp. NPDC094019]|uniref:helix-turn-helix domain-containing protein n=1 Tax=Kitasatospora sp. NPDC094019 TaxID=3364091 RepID=UPI00382C907C